MPNLTYDGPHDAVELDGVGVVERGETVEVSSSLAAALGGDWLSSDSAPDETAWSAHTVTELRALADERGLPSKGLKKAELVASLSSLASADEIPNPETVADGESSNNDAPQED